MGARDHPRISANVNPPPVAARLARLRAQTGWLLWAEQVLRLAAPPAGVMLAYVSLTLFGGGNPWACLAFAVAALGLAVAGLARLRWPSNAAIDRRIETSSGLTHRPLAALADRPESTDETALALWRHHTGGIATSLAAARAGGLVPGAAAADPYALRLLLLLLLLLSVLIAGPLAPARLAGALALPDLIDWPAPTAPAVQGWIISPDYAPTPPVLLQPGAAVTALAGSQITLIINGPRAAPAIHLGATRFSTTALAQSSHRANAVLTKSGRLRVGPWWHRLASWQVTVVAPVAPLITIGAITVAPVARLTLAYTVTDPYGLANLAAAVAPAGHPGALALNFALPTATGASHTLLDLTSSPFHGLPLGLRLTGQNTAGRSASTALSGTLVLPGPDLHDPTAIQLDRLRQQLALAPETGHGVGLVLAMTAAQPPSAITPGADVQMAVLAETLRERQAGAQYGVDRLLALIREIEAGPTFATAQDLQRADAALAAALQRGLHGTPPDPAALRNLLQALHQALAAQLAALQPSAAPAPMLNPAALDQLAAQIAADEAAGRTAQAARELQQLQAALQALETARPVSAQAAAAAQASAALSQLTAAQAGVLDATAQGTATPAQQAALQTTLAAIRRQLTQAGATPAAQAGAAPAAQAGAAPAGLQAAAQAMQNARQALGAADTGAAEAAENAAIQALQNAMARLQPNGPPGANGMPDQRDNTGLDQPTTNPAAAVQEQIIRRNANPSLPVPTHQYLQKLLQP